MIGPRILHITTIEYETCPRTIFNKWGNTVPAIKPNLNNCPNQMRESNFRLQRNSQKRVERSVSDRFETLLPLWHRDRRRMLFCLDAPKTFRIQKGQSISAEINCGSAATCTMPQEEYHCDHYKDYEVQISKGTTSAAKTFALTGLRQSKWYRISLFEAPLPITVPNRDRSLVRLAAMVLWCKMDLYYKIWSLLFSVRREVPFGKRNWLPVLPPTPSWNCLYGHDSPRFRVIHISFPLDAKYCYRGYMVCDNWKILCFTYQ